MSSRSSGRRASSRSEEHTSELQSLRHLVCRLLLEKNKYCRTVGRCLQKASLFRVAARAAFESPSPPFFFNDTVTTEIYTLSLHDALPILSVASTEFPRFGAAARESTETFENGGRRDRKSTRLNSSHLGISYAVFCLK